jgi:tRNA(fMet)-specific endonuclease VapC
MILAIDTNAYVDICRRVDDAVRLAQTADRLLLPFVVVAELRAGFQAGTRAPQNERVLARFRASPRVSVLYADEETTRHYARVWTRLRTAGTPIPTNDLWIAAIALQHDAVLFTRDGHFRHIPELGRIGS